MYRSETLFQVSNSEYCAVWSRSEFLGLGGAQHRKRESGVAQQIEDNFTDFRLTVQNFPNAQLLKEEEEIIDVTLRAVPIVGRTEIWDDNQGMRAMVECPIKTMNIHPERKRIQVDAGPLLFPDLSRTVERQVERFSVAFVCYNTFDLAEFILRVSTPSREGEVEIRSVLTYSDVRRMPAKSTIFSVEKV